jgi:hypothetical protein
MGDLVGFGILTGRDLHKARRDEAYEMWTWGSGHGGCEHGGREHGDDQQITDWTGIRVARTRKYSSLHRSLFTVPSDSETGPKVAENQLSVSVFARLIVKGSRISRMAGTLDVLDGSPVS